MQHNTPRVNYAIPLGLAYIGAALKNKGAEVKVIDAAAPYACYTQKDLARMVRNYSPHFVGITITTLFAAFAYELIKELKKENVTIVAGGPHPTLFPAEALNNGADIAVRGEGEMTIGELMDYFEGKMPLTDIAGISYRSANGDLIDNPPRAAISDLDLLPFPAKDIFEIRDYAMYRYELRRYGCIMSSRGCIGRCSFCSRAVFGRHFRFRSPENICLEMDQLSRNYGIRHFSFLDDVFTANKRRILDFCQAIKDRFASKFTWDCVTRVDCVTDELLEHMKKAGCSSINYGVESANPQTLKVLNKNETIEQIERCITRTKETGIEPTVNFMWGYPWETDEEFEHTLRFIKKIRYSAREIMPGGVLIPFPDTQIYEDYKQKYGFSNWWLNTDRWTGRYRASTQTPFFRIYLFDDQGQFEGGGFFNIDRPVMKRIERASFWLGWRNLINRHGFFIGTIIFIACYISWCLYQFSPYAETIYSNIINLLICLKNRLTRQRI